MIHGDLESEQEVTFALSLNQEDWGPSVPGRNSICRGLERQIDSRPPEFMSRHRYSLRHEERTWIDHERIWVLPHVREFLRLHSPSTLNQ